MHIIPIVVIFLLIYVPPSLNISAPLIINTVGRYFDYYKLTNTISFLLTAHRFQ